MNLRYKENYKSIETPFSEIDLPNFVVLTGKNGSGKTHLLREIKEGKFLIDNLDKREILYLNYLDFAQDFQITTNRAYQSSTWERFRNAIGSGNSGDAHFQLIHPT